MTYTLLDNPPTCRLYRVTKKRRIPKDRPYFVNGKDRLTWWSDGKRLLLHVAERIERRARNVPTQDYVKLKETRHHWYVVTK